MALISIKELQTGRFATRRYRNRRMGELLKELSLTEGRGTGIPEMLKTLRVNGSPKPGFETDNGRTFVLERLPLHSDFIKEVLMGEDCLTQNPALSNARS